MLCDTSLVYGFATRAEQIAADLVEEVIKDKKSFGIVPMRVQLEGAGS
jgi:hypothetical protein